VGISDPFGDTTRFVYDGAGRRIQKRGTGGLRTDYSYEAATGWLTNLTSYKSNGGPGSQFAYPYDEVGNRLQMTEGGSALTTYTYDALDRLASVDPPDEAVFPANGEKTWFAYDGAGNRTDFGPQSGGSFVSPHTTYTYHATLKHLQNIKVNGAISEIFTYDGNGYAESWTPPGEAPRTLGYDALGRLVSIGWGFEASYAYDPFGRRIEKTEEGETTRYQYDGVDVVAEYGATGLAATYVFGPGLDEVLKQQRGPTVAAYHTDGLGSVTAISEGATLRNSYRYDAFGTPVAQGGSTPLANAYTYTGRERDASGLYYYRARYYLPSAGRFLTPDPIGLEGGLNAYVYVGSNPVNYTDPFGLTAGSSFAPAAPVVFQAGFLSAPDDILQAASQGAALLGGAGQIGTGLALCSTVAACVAGAPLIALGVNNIQEGLSGQDGFLRNLAEGGARELGFSESTGSIAFSIADATTSIGGLLLRSVPKQGRIVLESGFRTQPIRLFRSIPSDFERNFNQLTKFAIGRELVLTGVGLFNTFRNSGSSP
jgi:RHS repeat-associated protein